MLPKRFTYPAPGFSKYWTYGSGETMLKKLNHIPTKESIEDYAKLLLDYDVIGDSVIKEVFEKQGFHKANDLVNEILEKGINNVANIPECLQKLFTEVDTIPDWVDWDLLNAGSTFCRRTGAFAFIVLRNFCLMGGYESSAINKPLIYTGALKKGAAKRMAETVEFWVNATGEDALKGNAIGFKTTIKVRLMHAYARHSILKLTDWDNNLWGAPINQCDMVATNIGFSLVFMEGLKMLGFRPTEKEIKGLLHLWKYIGYLLGIPTANLPDTEIEAIELLYKWTMFQSPADEDTKALAHALMNEPLYASYPKHMWQKKLYIRIHLGYNNFFLTDRACQIMDLPKSNFRFLPHIASTINSSEEFFVLSQKGLLKRKIKSGRKQQEEITAAFLKGHASSLDEHKHKV